MSDPLDLQGHLAEVEEEAVVTSYRAQVRPDHGEVLRDEVAHRLQLDDDLVSHEKVEAVKPHLLATVRDGHGKLTNERYSTMRELHDQSGLVDRIHEARTERTVDFDPPSR